MSNRSKAKALKKARRGMKGKGTSKYALKVARRRNLCKRHGLRDTPYPVLWFNGIH